jgi:hypothetical protein
MPQIMIHPEERRKTPIANPATPLVYQRREANKNGTGRCKRPMP